MSTKFNNKRYNKLLSYRNNYFALGGNPYNFNNVQNPLQGWVDSYSGGYPVDNGNTDDATSALASLISSPNLNFNAQKQAYHNPTFFDKVGTSFNEGKLNPLINAVGSASSGLISGGLSSGVGNAFSSLGNIAATIPGPWGAVASAALNVTGGLTNQLFGSKINDANVRKVESDISRLNNFQSDASSFDTLANTWSNTNLGYGFSNSFIGRDGLFSSKARRKANSLRNQLQAAGNYAENAMINNADNITQNTLSQLEANYAALGGYLNHFGDGGSIHINPANRGKFNATKKRTGKTTEELTHSKNPLTRKRAIFAQNASHWKHALGGILNSDYPTGLTFINEGGSHESNPNEGIQMGTAPDGKPNLVEEGESIYNDYVYSNRLKVPNNFKEKYKLRGKDLTFSDAVKQLSKSTLERPNDSISKSTLNDILGELAMVQENVRETQTGRQYSYGGILGHHYSGEGLGNQVLSMNNRTPNITFGVEGFNPYDSEGNINWDVMYGANSPYMKRRQYVLDNWNSPKVQQWLGKYVAGINEYNKNREGYTPMSVGDITRDIFEKRTFDKSWGGMHAGIDYAGDPNIQEKTRYFLRSKDKDGNIAVKPWDVTPWEGFNTEGKQFSDLYPGYTLAGKQKREQEGDTIYTDIYYNAPDDNKKGANPQNIELSDESLRFVPAYGLGLTALTDALGLTNKPDYSDADAIEAVSRSGNYKPVAYSPIGNRLTYNPYDINFYTNKLNAQSAATRRAIEEQGAGSGRTIAGILAADYASQDKLGEAYRNALLYNNEERQKVEDFNSRIAAQNAQGMLQADTTNAQSAAALRESALRGVLSGAEMRQRAKLAADQAKSANLSGLLNTLGDIGYENKSMNMIRGLYASGALGPMTDKVAEMFDIIKPNVKKKKSILGLFNI